MAVRPSATVGPVRSAHQAGGLSYWWQRNQIKVIPYLYIAPFFVLFAIFLAYPVVNSFWISFYKQQGISTPEFVGLRNYLNLLSDPRFKQSVINSTVYALGSLFVQIPLAFILAVTIHSWLVPWLNVKSFYRLAFFVPLLTSGVVVALMFGILYDYNSGLINSYLMNLFGEDAKIGWVRDARVVKLSIILLLVWQFTGLNSLYFLAGLQNIPRELEESAAIDGANGWTILTRITIPLLRPVILFVVITAINGSYQIFTQPYLLTGGGPRDQSISMVMYLYNTGFSYFNLGYASAIGYTLVLIVVTLAVLNLRFFGAFREDR
ncbi:MAG TPA: sugar ABC transporter permease [Caldilineaceae bacterium]|nr:sugar ABC transporter permease [Caldilineaceae bacterium]